MTKILRSSDTCAELLSAPRSGLLIDGRDFYRAFYDAASKARRSIVMAGWQFDSAVTLLRGDDARGARYPLELLEFLRALCEERPALEIHILAWEASALFAMERQWFQKLHFRWKGHKRIHFKMDDCHPVTGSQHQKFIVVDRSIAFVGGMDLCGSRWDDRDHEVDNPLRANVHRRYAPYHDVQSYVTGEAVDVLRRWFCERWGRATCTDLALAEAPDVHIPIVASVEIAVTTVALSRTLPEMDDPPCDECGEICALHAAAIASAERVIYIENQYFSSEDVRRSLIERMRRSPAGDAPLQIVIVLPHKSAGFKEQIAIGVRQAEILRELEAVSAETGHQVGIYYQAAPGKDGDVPVFVHAKVLAVDDRFLLVSSANATNRSMGLDTELGLAWESEEAAPSLRAARVELMREHCGLDRDEADRVLGEIDGLIARCDGMADARSHRLRRHPMHEDSEPAEVLSRALRDDLPLDPREPVFEDLFPEPSRMPAHHLLDRLRLAWHRAGDLSRGIRRRRRSRTRRRATASGGS